MRKDFASYFKLTQSEIDEVWTNGIVTFDTNVLLDLYRYRESTRQSLLQSIKSAGGTKWLARQAATEFFRNRTAAIISAEKTFRDANIEIDKLVKAGQSAVSQLRGNRIIPEEVPDELAKNLDSAVFDAQRAIKSARDSHPDFIEHDPILEELAVLFDGSVGPEFSEDQFEEAKREAERRKIAKIPPGYLDHDKDDLRSYGDYLLWRQILNHAKSQERPVLLVTSERSDDWWERIGGRTTGPRPEMLKEAREFTGQVVAIYQTESFLQFSLERGNKSVDAEAIAEIRAVNVRRNDRAAVSLIEQLVEVATEQVNVGILFLELLRPVRGFTVSGKFAPNMAWVPLITAEIIELPNDAPAPTRINAATGTLHDFNINVRSSEVFAVGLYSFYYEAKCSEDQVTDLSRQGLEYLSVEAGNPAFVRDNSLTEKEASRDMPPLIPID